jgi:hypothetical protein
MIPPQPDVPESHRARGKLTLRFEDVTQDGRLVLESIPTAVGPIWRDAISPQPYSRALMKQGVLAILSRLVVEAYEGPFSIAAQVECDGCFAYSHSVDDGGEVDRIYLDMWSSLTAPIGRTYGPPPDGAGENVPAARLYAEHVFTRPFGPPDQRKVLRVDAQGMDPVPGPRREARRMQDILAIPHGARALDDALSIDGPGTPLGLLHTDSNQHVNSLVYPRHLEEAALRRFARHGIVTRTLGRNLEIAFKKPFFAGETMHVAVRAFTEPLGIAAVFLDVPDVAARPRAYARLTFDQRTKIMP